MRGSWKNLALRSLGFLILAVVLSRMDFRLLGAALLRMSPPILAAAVAVNFLAIAVKALRWQYILRSYGRRDPLPRVLGANFAGYFLGLISPGQAGEFAKIILLPDAGPGLLPSVLADRMLDVLPLLIIGLAGGVIYLGFPWWAMLPAAGAAILPIALFAWFQKHPPAPGAAPEGTGRLRTLWSRAIRACLPLLSMRLWPMVGIVATTQVFLFGYIYLLALALNLRVNFIHLIFFISLLSLARILPISVMGVGTRDALAVLLFGSIGVPKEQALSFSISILLVDVLYLAAGFAVYQVMAGKAAKRRAAGAAVD